MIMCDVRASGIPGEVDDSYLMGVELRANGGANVTWTDLPDQAMVFDDAAAAAEFCRDSPARDVRGFVRSGVRCSRPARSPRRRLRPSRSASLTSCGRWA
jgi:hypothetical protein